MSRTPTLLQVLTEIHKDRIESVWKKTVESAATEASDFLDLCVMIWTKCSKEVDKEVTITYYMHAMIWDELLNVYYQAVGGYYLPCVRNLRFIFEFAAVAHILEEKFAKMPEGEAKIKRAISDPNFSGFKYTMLQKLMPSLVSCKEHDALVTLYRELSVKGAHPVAKFIFNLNALTVAFHNFDLGLFRDCKELCRKVVDFVLIVLMSRYPSLGNDTELKKLIVSLDLPMSLRRMVV